MTNYSDMGNVPSGDQITLNQSGRLGIIFVIIGCTLLSELLILYSCVYVLWVIQHNRKALTQGRERDQEEDQGAEEERSP